MIPPIEPQPETPAARPVERPGVGVDQVLAGLRVSGPGARGGLDRFRLGPAAAGALRAAIDCLTGDDASAPVQVMADESALEVRCTAVDPEGLVAAGGVIEAVEGNLAPTLAVPGSWSLRLALLSARETFLMIERGGVPIALPWHAVTRVRMVTHTGLDALAAREGIPLANPLGLGIEEGGDRPAVLLGLGLRRAYVLADRLVWRMTAEPVEPSSPRPDPRFGPALQAGDERFWLLEPAEALQGVPMPALPHAHEAVARALAALLPATPEKKPETVAPPDATATPRAAIDDITVLEPGSVLPLADSEARNADAPVVTDEFEATPRSESESEPEPETMPRPWPPLRLIELTPSDVDPFGDDDPLAADLAPAPAIVERVPEAAPPPAPIGLETPLVEPVALPAPEPAPAGARATRETAPRALIAEDSFIASIFLERLLAQRGFAVRVVGRASELLLALGSESWDLVLADVELPDAHGAPWLSGVAGQRADGAPAPLVALVRDDEDVALAESAGVRRVLRKPFEGADLDRLLRVLELAGSRRER